MTEPDIENVQQLEPSHYTATSIESASNIKIFACKYCAKTFKFAQGMYRHVSERCPQNPKLQTPLAATLPVSTETRPKLELKLRNPATNKEPIKRVFNLINNKLSELDQLADTINQKTKAAQLKHILSELNSLIQVNIQLTNCT
jgi:hypothetical protein